MSWAFQSSFELTGYITIVSTVTLVVYGLFQSSFELTGYITILYYALYQSRYRFKALSSLQVI